jgi:hypothetical protein
MNNIYRESLKKLASMSRNNWRKKLLRNNMAQIATSQWLTAGMLPTPVCSILPHIQHILLQQYLV